jgi:phosphoserine phosphatase
MLSVHVLANDPALLSDALCQRIIAQLQPKAVLSPTHFVCATNDAGALYAAVRALLNGLPIDVLVLPQPLPSVRLVVADMESTMIEQEMLDELAALLGIHDQVAAITRRAMNGELDFTAALQERVALLRGQPASLLDQAAQRMTLMPGADVLLSTLKGKGAACWLVSGGFTVFAEPVARRLGFDRCFANELVIEQGVITGTVREPILDKDAKLRILQQGCTELGIDRAQTMALGDGANDIPMLQAAGLGIAYHAKPIVRQAVPHQLNHGNWQVLAELLA